MAVNYDLIAKEIVDTIGADKVFTEIHERMAYSRDWSVRPFNELSLPDIVVRPTSTEDVAATVRIAYKHGVPVIPCGGLTGMAGGAVPTYGGIMIDTRGMNRILELDIDNLTVTVQAGITISKLNSELEKHGLWFPHDPESKQAATVGASIATRNDSTFGIKYGKIEQSVIGLVLVDGVGDIVRLGQRKTLISSSGYRLHWLLVGSEGTLGIITEATLRIFPKPKERCVDMVAFKTFADATKAVNRIVQAGLSIESVNIMCSNRFQYYTHAYRVKYGKEAKVPSGTRAILCLTFNGDSEVVNFSRNYALKICREMGGIVVEEREIVNAWWTSKHVLKFEPGRQKWPDSQRIERFGAADASIPMGRLDEAYEKFKELALRNGLKILGMNVYVQAPYSLHTSVSFAVYVNDKDVDNIKRFYNYVKEMGLYALSIGGSSTSYQGDGEKYAGVLCEIEHKDSLKLISSIKNIFDPKHIMNPGKKFGSSKWIKMGD
jgi:FAD/FMN-containing dehydrogenase